MRKPTYLFTSLFALLAVIYNSWPLGFLLDPSTAKNGLASDLEDPHHAYSWVFTGGDVLFGLILIFLVIFIYRSKVKARFKSGWLVTLCFGLFLFGFFTAFGASAPDNCNGTIDVCFSVGHESLSPDSLETSLAALGLFLALACSAVLALKLGRPLRLLSWMSLSLWMICGARLSISLVNNGNIHTLQQAFLLLCGLGLISIGINLDKMISKIA